LPAQFFFQTIDIICNIFPWALSSAGHQAHKKGKNGSVCRMQIAGGQPTQYLPVTPKRTGDYADVLLTKWLFIQLHV
jgi:hypothetical protein